MATQVKHQIALRWLVVQLYLPVPAQQILVYAVQTLIVQESQHPNIPVRRLIGIVVYKRLCIGFGVYIKFEH